ncbi:hypothetical protein RRF57_003688 [Xylaria bambusicola]|uniref:Uncharacterized protein n=1 Tax=Xylaria bambusicola TaxID=326684 RepID=A0AAN7UFG6_9PEZI
MSLYTSKIYWFSGNHHSVVLLVREWSSKWLVLDVNLQWGDLSVISGLEELASFDVIHPTPGYFIVSQSTPEEVDNGKREDVFN